MEAELAKIHVPLLYTRIWQLVAVDYGVPLRCVMVHLCMFVFLSEDICLGTSTSIHLKVHLCTLTWATYKG